MENRIPAPQLEAWKKEVAKAKQEKEVVSLKEKVEGYKDAILKQISQDKFKVRFNAGLAALGMTYDDYKKYLKDEALNPDVALKIAELGKKQYTEGELKVKDGEPAGLPSNPEVLRARIQELSVQRMRLKRSAKDYTSVEDELKKVQAKFTEASRALRQDEKSFV